MRGNLRAHLQDHRSLCTLAHLPSVKAGCVRAGACPSARAGAPSGKVRPTEGPCRYPPSFPLPSKPLFRAIGAICLLSVFQHPHAFFGLIVKK